MSVDILRIHTYSIIWERIALLLLELGRALRGAASGVQHFADYTDLDSGSETGGTRGKTHI